MPLFRKKKQATDQTNAGDAEASLETNGLAPDQVERLLELLEHEGGNRVVFRRREGKLMDMVKGWVLRKPPYRLTIAEAKVLIQEIAEKHRNRHEQLLKKKRRQDTGIPFMKTLWANAINYPSELTPDDVLEAEQAARHRLEETAKSKGEETATERQAKKIFEALEQMRNEEATLFVRRYAIMQRDFMEKQAAARKQRRLTMPILLPHTGSMMPSWSGCDHCRGSAKNR